MYFKTYRLFILLISILGCSAVNEKTNFTAPFNGKTFDNLQPFEVKSFWDVIKWRMTSKRSEWPLNVENEAQDLPAPLVESSSPTFLMINHATILIQVDGLNFLTDPIYSERSSPVSFAGPKRVRKPALDFDKLPPIHAVVISHNHYDHLDLPTLLKLEEKFSPTFYVGLKNTELLKSAGIKKVIEMDWWQKIQLNDVHLSFVPAQHWSARGLFDRYETLWGGFFIEGSSHKIYFAGDTGYGDFFKQIKERLGAPDLSFLPIGAYEPRWFMKGAHMNPEDAVMAHMDLESKFSVGMHFGAFQLTDEAITDPVTDLKKAQEKLKPNHPFLAPIFGKLYYVKF